MKTPYPGYDVLDKWDTPSFNAVTREVLTRRMHAAPGPRFFTTDEFALLEAICARLIPQPERAEPVAIAPWIDADIQDATLAAIQNGEADLAGFGGVPAADFFKSVLLKAAVGVYYSHPAAWSEMGYGGPASPRGYVRLGVGERDPWEARLAPPPNPAPGSGQ